MPWRGVVGAAGMYAVSFTIESLGENKYRPSNPQKAYSIKNAVCTDLVVCTDLAEYTNLAVCTDLAVSQVTL